MIIRFDQTELTASIFNLQCINVVAMLCVRINPL